MAEAQLSRGRNLPFLQLQYCCGHELLASALDAPFSDSESHDSESGRWPYVNNSRHNHSSAANLSQSKLTCNLKMRIFKSTLGKWSSTDVYRL